MAIDKAIDSTQLNTDLTSIADAIREKAGLTDSFVFPEGFVEAIAGIEAGGSIVMGTYTPASDQSSRVTITHGLGVAPAGVAFLKRNNNVIANDTVAFSWASGGYGVRVLNYNGTLNLSRVSVSGAKTQVHTMNHANGDIVCGLTENTFQTPEDLSAAEHLWFVWA